jgi:hypothetical protein
MLPVGQLPQLSPGSGIGNYLQRYLKPTAPFYRPGNSLGALGLPVPSLTDTFGDHDNRGKEPSARKGGTRTTVPTATGEVVEGDHAAKVTAVIGFWVSVSNWSLVTVE